MTAVRVRVRVEGVVQGVGFRPYVHRLAVELGLGGFVRNDSRGAVIEVEGPPDAIDALLARLRAEAPPAAVIEGVQQEDVPPRGEQGFGDRAERAVGHAGRARSRPTSRPARRACASCVTRPTAATATRSSTAPTAGRASRSSAASRTTGR